MAKPDLVDIFTDSRRKRLPSSEKEQFDADSYVVENERANDKAITLLTRAQIRRQLEENKENN